MRSVELVARELVREMQITSADLGRDPSKSKSGPHLWTLKGQQVRAFVRGSAPELVAMVMAEGLSLEEGWGAGNTSLAEVHGKSYLLATMSGREIAEIVAATSIVAAIVDCLLE